MLLKVPMVVGVPLRVMVVPLSAAEVYQRSIKGSKVVTIDNCGHYPGVEQPAEFLKQVRAFLG